MRDYEYLFATNLQQKLKEKIIGKVFVKINANDELYIKIERHEEGVMYEASYDEFSQKFINGWTTEYAAYEVLKNYKSSLMKRYFK